MIVVDASVLVPALSDDGHDGAEARARLASHVLVAPELIDLEVVSVFRRLARMGRLEARRVNLALADLDDLPLRRAPHLPLLTRCWELRGNMTIYDAAYIALAEAMEVVFVTADARLARAPGIGCEVEVLGVAR